MGKRLIVCSDGTWNTPDQQKDGSPCPTNVVKLSRAVAPMSHDGKVQVVFYDRGVGTGGGIDRWTGGAFGRGLARNVEDAYRFLMDNFNSGDEIYLFGFSRGAYTVRSTAGMVRNCGLLLKRFAHLVPDAYAMYRRRDVHPDDDVARSFRARHAVETRIHFIGVWDTVGALGIPIGWLRFLTRHRYQFHDVTLSSTIDRAFQALAIDEHRSPFRPSIWETQPHASQQVEQVWFSGAHSNVGGGYTDAGLSDLALLWMVEKARAAGLGFDDSYLDEVIEPDFRGRLVNSRSGIYRLSRKYIRPISVGRDRTQRIDPSVEHRRGDPSLAYAPKNLIAALQQGIPA